MCDLLTERPRDAIAHGLALLVHSVHAGIAIVGAHHRLFHLEQTSTNVLHRKEVKKLVKKLVLKKKKIERCASNNNNNKISTITKMPIFGRFHLIRVLLGIVFVILFIALISKNQEDNSIIKLKPAEQSDSLTWAELEKISQVNTTCPLCFGRDACQV